MLKQSAHLTLQMEVLLIPCISVLLRKPNMTFLDLRRFMFDHRNADLVRAGLQLPNPAHRHFFEDLFESEIYQHTRHSIATKCQYLLNSEWFVRLVAAPKSTIQLSKALNAGKKIIVNLAKGQLGTETSESLGKLLVAMIAGSVFSRHRQPRQLRTPVHLVIDECHLLLSHDVKMILAEARKFGLHVTLAQQHVGQEMSSSMRNTVLTNTFVKILAGRAHTNRATLAPHFHVKPEDIPLLRPGSFFTRTRERNHCFTLPGRFVGNRCRASQQQWSATKAKQLQRFYTEPEDLEVWDGERLESRLHESDEPSSIPRTPKPKPPRPQRSKKSQRAQKSRKSSRPKHRHAPVSSGRASHFHPNPNTFNPDASVPRFPTSPPRASEIQDRPSDR